MRLFWLLLLGLIVLNSCSNNNSDTTSPLSRIPSDSEIILKINNLEALKSGLKNNTLLTEIGAAPSLSSLKSQLTPLAYFQNASPIYIGIKKEDNDNVQISIVTHYKDHIIQFDSIPNLVVESFGSGDDTIKKLTLNDLTYYSTSKDSILFISNRMNLAKNSLTPTQLPTTIQELFETSDNEQSVSIFYKNNRIGLGQLLLPDTLKDQASFSKLSVIDVDISQNDIYFNGVTEARDSSQTLINKFRGSIPQQNKMASICPASVTHFTSFTSQNMQMLRQNFHNIALNDSLAKPNRIYDNITEFGELVIEDTPAFLLYSLDPTSTFEALESEQINSSYRTIDIYSLDTDENFAATFAPLISVTAPKYYVNIDDFFVFAEDISVLETIISNYQNGTVLSESDAYKDLMLHLSDESSFFIFDSAQFLKKRLEKYFENAEGFELGKYETSALQFIYDTNFAHVNAAFKTFKNKGNDNQISEEVNIAIDSDLLTSPQFVKNHTNNQMDVAVQDINNNLYLISNKGKVFWKKQLNGKILGKIEQIDMYKNGRLQLAFATSNRVYVLDRNGNDVSPFPLKFNDKITQPLSVFDYANKRNYRLLVTQGKSLLMYDQLGNSVDGFKYDADNSTISTQPKHFRVGTKDYIVFAKGDHLEILDRVGDRRIDVKEAIVFSDNEIYLYDNHFTTTNANGELLKVNQNGTVKHENLNLKDNHKITTTSKTFVALSDNKLTIKSNTISLDFGNYTEPSIFYIRDKIYVSVTDLQSKKVYLFDSQAKPISNFPVYGNSKIDMFNVDKDSSLELITKGSNNSMIIYTLN
ncbi:hypothetical protein [Sediminibacter sp. Hel_I_10]|uniref:hypothetical protein n=1 Tax=Sediminibacter sp. Hel_I_10 TaxID=1392490 RepID=UPI0004787F6A|nr:hypothetical protein [Sediminibacter sp. Hel_I_10]